MRITGRRDVGSLGGLGLWENGSRITFRRMGWCRDGSSNRVFPEIKSLIFGGVGALFMSLMAMGWASRKQLRLEPTVLLGQGERAGEEGPSSKRRKWLDSSIPSLIALLGAGGLALTIDFSGPDASMGFFGVGALLLTGGILYFRSRLASYASKVGIWRNATDLNRRNAARRIGRSMVTVGVMSAGSFLVVSTGAFRKAPPDSLHQKASGTGGFSFLGESALPIYDDLNAIAGQEDDPYDLNASLLAEAKVVPLRVRMGDDAELP